MQKQMLLPSHHENELISVHEVPWEQRRFTPFPGTSLLEGGGGANSRCSGVTPQKENVRGFQAEGKEA